MGGGGEVQREPCSDYNVKGSHMMHLKAQQPRSKEQKRQGFRRHEFSASL